MHPGSLRQSSPYRCVHWSFRSKHTKQKPCLNSQNKTWWPWKGVWRKQHLQSPLEKGKITQRVHVYYALPLTFALSFRKAANSFPLISMDFLSPQVLAHVRSMPSCTASPVSSLSGGQPRVESGKKREMDWFPRIAATDYYKLLTSNNRHVFSHRASLIAQLVKNPLAMQESRFDSWIGRIRWRRDRLPTPVLVGVT